jgi:non-canonical purine NTP pyrophosphatase (RdgB/HAM1 family)
MKLVLASNNAGKLAELQALFAPLGVELVCQSVLGISEAPEPYRTFVENALAKARHAARESGLPALADDAGLCVEAFGGLPGVDTAYYATQFGYEKGDANNVRALLEQMQGQTDRRAALVSTLVALRSADDPEPLVARVHHRAPDWRQRFRFRSGDVPTLVRQNVCRTAYRGEKRQQPPGQGGATHAGTDARSLVFARTW